jgi:succinate-semialdehyde dehydrogenase/glutarate-semialdehyde dehydrogenase
VRQRADVLLRWHDLVLQRRREIADLMQYETGKSRRDVMEEILDVAHAARYNARMAPRLLRPQRRRNASPIVFSGRVLHPPKGLVGVIMPWNYPLVLMINDLAPALVTGNAALVKPDHQTPLTALYAASLMYEAGLPRDVLQVLVGEGPTTGAAIVEEVDHVAFTGSTATGRIIGARCGERLIGCSLELGGKNAALVLADADIARTARGLAIASFANAGQLCQSMERIYVVDAVYEQFRDAFLAETAALRVGPGLDFTHDVGSLIDTGHLAKVDGHVTEAVAAGAQVLIGGHPLAEAGPTFYAPTVLEGVTRSMRVVTEETFGPVTGLYRVADTEAAIVAANDAQYGLNASIWSRDERAARAVASRLRAGTVHINDGYGGIWALVDLPLGGMGDSGLGRRNGPEGLLRYTEPQAVITQRFINVNGPPGAAYEQWQRVLTGYVVALKRLGRT